MRFGITQLLFSHMLYSATRVFFYIAQLVARIYFTHEKACTDELVAESKFDGNAYSNRLLGEPGDTADR